MFYCVFCRIFQNNLFTEYVWVTACVLLKVIEHLERINHCIYLSKNFYATRLATYATNICTVKVSLENLNGLRKHPD